MTDELSALFIERSCYFLGVEYPAKIDLAVGTITPEQLWWRPNAQSNSAGNLLLHLSGNVRQWIVSGIGACPDTRQRDLEFSAQQGESAAVLLSQLRNACADAVRVIAKLSASDLTETRLIQGRQTTVFSAVYHVVEHFSGHTGQLILMAKQFGNQPVVFYDDTDGLARPVFLPDGVTGAD